MIKINVNGYEEIVKENRFPDGTLLLNIDIIFNFEDYREATVSWFFDNNEELVTLIYITKSLQAHGVTSIYLNMPYIPNARQDRVRNNSDVFTLKYFTEAINWLGFDSVRVLDPHSHVSEALIDNIIIDTPDNYIDNVLRLITKETNNDDITLFFPDEGSKKRYADMLNSPYCFGVKRRDWKTGEIQGLDVIGDEEFICDKDILIVDDICSRGGTFYHSAKKLKALGANKIYLYVTHCEDTILKGDLLESGLIEKVFTTNSIFTKEHEKIEVMEVNYRYE